MCMYSEARAPLYTKEEKTLWWNGTAWLFGRFGWVYQLEKNHPIFFAFIALLLFIPALHFCEMRLILSGVVGESIPVKIEHPNNYVTTRCPPPYSHFPPPPRLLHLPRSPLPPSPPPRFPATHSCSILITNYHGGSRNDQNRPQPCRRHGQHEARGAARRVWRERRTSARYARRNN